MSDNKDLPAFPIPEEDYKRFLNEMPLWTGLTKREIFAMAAMQGLCASQTGHTYHEKGLALKAMQIADETLSQLSKPQP